ncbi:TonB-dependent receptor [Asticcacaulis sp. AND118]|uniref:TonB-dependent receptor n=1 Tax=Asticcacaulis sp. AND118 TaxID=2840468 RepID=UPI001CFF959B|nr:TonB-dependent receptor [Asticcacaulis sp. AND118]UDF03026.1 TonB-dependent receptor [Asticcacaulis sp. AND118]
MPHRQLLLFTALAGLMTAPAVMAQTDETAASTADANGDAEEVVVIGRRFGSGLTRATFTLGKTDIEERPMGADIMQSLNKVPGLSVATGDARGGTFSFEMYMRGLTDEQIGLTLDGVPTGDSRFNGGSPPARFIESSNVGRIVVSQSAGDIGAPSRFALGGFIDFVTDNPKPQFGATVEAGAGSFDFGRLYARMDTGEIAKGLSAYITASTQENDVWTGRNRRSSQRDHYEFKAVKRFESGSSLMARLSYNEQADNDFNIITLPQFRQNPNSDFATDAVSGIPAVDVNYGGALGGTREDFLAYISGSFVLSNRVTLKVSPYYQTLRGESFRYQDRSRVLTGGDPRAVTGYNANGGATRPALTTLRNSNVVGGPADMRVTPRDRDRYGVTDELIVSDIAAAGLSHTFRLGSWYERSESSEKRNFYPVISPATSTDYDRSRLTYVEYEREAVLESTMLYAQDEIKALGDRLTVDLGATWYKLTYNARSPLEYKAVVDFSQESDINPKVGINYRLTDRVELFGGYARNFAGIPEDAFLGSTAVIDPKDLEPVTTENLDLGVRYVAPNMALSLQAYDVKLEQNVGIVPIDTVGLEPDEIIRGNVTTKAANTQGQKTKGVDLTGFYDFGSVDLYGAYTYIDAKHDDPAVGSAERRKLASLAIIGGARVRDIPEHSAFVQVGWSPLPNARMVLNARHVGERVGAHVVLQTTFQEIGVETLPAYTVVGLNGTYDVKSPGSDIRLQLNIDNLFDEDYIASVSGATATQPEFGATIANPAGRTLTRYFLGAPRTVTVSVRMAF